MDSMAEIFMDRSDNEFSNSKDKISIEFMGINAADIEKYSIGKKDMIKLNKEEKMMLDYIAQNSLLLELKKETSIMQKSGLKVETEAINHYLEKNKEKLRDYAKRKTT